MFSDLASIREAVEARLAPRLPDTWRWVPYLEGTNKTLVPVVYLEFVAFEPRVQNSNLALGQVAARFNIVVTDPKTDTEKAEDDVDEHVLGVIRALDDMSDMYWDTAEKKRLDVGPLAWTISTFAIADTTTEE